MRTYRHNAALKKYRLINARKAAKKLREEPEPTTRTIEPVAGEKFGKLTAIEPAERDEGGRPRWWFECECGERVAWQLATVKYNLRKLGWCSCPSCYVEAGGWRGIEESA